MRNARLVMISYIRRKKAALREDGIICDPVYQKPNSLTKKFHPILLKISSALYC